MAFAAEVLRPDRADEPSGPAGGEPLQFGHQADGAFFKIMRRHKRQSHADGRGAFHPHRPPDTQWRDAAVKPAESVVEHHGRPPMPDIPDPPVTGCWIEFHDQRVLILKEGSDVELRTAEHPLVLPEQFPVEPDCGPGGHAVKDELFLPAADRPRKTALKPPLSETRLAGDEIVFADVRVGNFAGFLKGGVDAAGNFGGDRILPIPGQAVCFLSSVGHLPSAVQRNNGHARDTLRLPLLQGHLHGRGVHRRRAGLETLPVNLIHGDFFQHGNSRLVQAGDIVDRAVGVQGIHAPEPERFLIRHRGLPSIS